MAIPPNRASARTNRLPVTVRVVVFLCLALLFWFPHPAAAHDDDGGKLQAGGNGIIADAQAMADAIADDHARFRALISLARARIVTADNVGALGDLRSAQLIAEKLDIAGTRDVALAEVAACMADAGSPKEALEIAREARPSQQRNEAAKSIIRVLMMADDEAGAEAVLTSMMDRSTQDQGLRVMVAVEMGRHQYEKARAFAGRIVFGGWDNLIDIAIEQAKTGDQAGARATLDQARTAQGASSHTVYALTAMGQYPAAIEEAGHIRNPTARELTWLDLTLVLSKANRLSEAEATAELIQSARNRADAFAGLADAEASRGDLGKAKLFAEKARSFAELIQQSNKIDRWEVIRRVVNAQIAAHDFAGAQVTANLQQGNFRINSMLAIARALMSTGETAQSRKILDEVVESALSVSMISVLAAADAQRELGLNEDAMSTLRKARESASSDRGYDDFAQIAEYYLKIGSIADASSVAKEMPPGRAWVSVMCDIAQSQAKSGDIGAAQSTLGTVGDTAIKSFSRADEYILQMVLSASFVTGDLPLALMTARHFPSPELQVWAMAKVATWQKTGAVPTWLYGKYE